MRSERVRGEREKRDFCDFQLFAKNPSNLSNRLRSHITDMDCGPRTQRDMMRRVHKHITVFNVKTAVTFPINKVCVCVCVCVFLSRSLSLSI